MSWTTWGLGQYTVSIHDSAWNYIEVPNSLEYLENTKIQGKVRNGDKESVIDFPLSTFCDFEPTNGGFCYVESEQSPFWWIFKRLKAKGKLPMVSAMVCTTKGLDLYLSSPIGDDSLVFTPAPVWFQLETEEQVRWIWKHKLGIECKNN